MQKLFSTKNLAKMGIMAAACYILTFFEFPIFPAAEFLKLDFSNVMVLLVGYIVGPIQALIVNLVCQLLCIFKSDTGGIGQLANIIVNTSFILVPTFVYKYKKGFKTVIWTLMVGTAMQTISALLCNRFIMFPLYMGDGAVAVFKSIWQWVLLFNIIKGITISAISIILYKRLKGLFKIMGLNDISNGNLSKLNNKNIFISHSYTETIDFAKEYSKTLKSDDVVLLKGEMGAGKTVFAKGVAAGLGIKDEVLSPTYAYMNDYNGLLYHYDCYRLSSGSEAESLGLTDYFYGKGICLIEWSENILSVLPKDTKTIEIIIINENERKIIW